MVKTDIWYPDPQTRQALLRNLRDAMDEAASMEDERLASQGQADIDIPAIVIQPAQKPSIPPAHEDARHGLGL